MIVDVQGGAGLAIQRVPSSYNSDNFVRLKYFHFPDLPLLDVFTAGFTVNGTVFDIPAVSSLKRCTNIRRLRSKSWQKS